MYSTLKTSFYQALTAFSKLLFALLICFLVVRAIEFSYAPKAAIVIKYVLWFDLLLFLKILPFLFITFFVLYTIIPKYEKVVLFIIGSIVLLIYSTLALYFNTAQVPLGADMFGYSWGDSFIIVKDSLSWNLQLAIFLIIPLLVYGLLNKFLNGFRLKGGYVAPLLFIGLLINIFKLSTLPESTQFKSEFAYYTSTNKAAFFMESLTHYFEQPLIKDAKGGQEPKYLDPQHPFLRIENSSDVLSAHFKINSRKPDLVFIQVEGLGRAFSGPRAYLGSFTPFLDELAVKSIYFENFLSAQGRTFAALPSILGSLPFAETGFSDLAHQMPKFHSLISIVNNNGYKSTYYGGFDMEFDYQGLFMEKAGISKVIGANNFNRQLSMASPIGYSDGDLLNKVLQELGNDTGPRLAYIQTISMHNPFTIPNQDRYLKLVAQRMDELNFDPNKRIACQENFKIYASIMYTDEVLRNFFTAYAKLPSYQNTIFIITGDHRLPEIPLSTKIDRYHVPLIIFSPLLKKSLSIGAISSHLDIAPSFAMFLRNSHKMVTPEKVTWVGTGLDLHIGFRNIHSYPLKQGKTVLHNYIKGTYFMDNQKLFAISDGMELSPVADEKQYHILAQELIEYQTKNRSFLASKQLLQDHH